jgi:hypothetical protein
MVIHFLHQTLDMDSQKRVAVYKKVISCLNQQWYFVHVDNFPDDVSATKYAVEMNAAEPTVQMALCSKQHLKDWAHVVTTNNKHLGIRVYFVGTAPNPEIHEYCQSRNIDVIC